MKAVLLCFFIAAGYSMSAQTFKEGYIVDASGQKFEGLIRYEPGNQEKPGMVIFKEGKKGKKEEYGPNYVRSFKIDADSFAVVKNIAMPRQKVREADFVRVLLVGVKGVLYAYEYDLAKTSQHAASDYVIMQENTKFLVSSNGKLSILTASNFRNFAPVVGDCEALRAKIANGKVRLSAIQSVIDEYKTCKTK
jgi:hypothetical protein